jgi:hypothetical protein
VLIEPDAPIVAKVKAVIEHAAGKKWGAKAPAILKSLYAGGKVALGDGNTKAQYAGYEGMLFVNARNKVAPGVFDRDKSELTQADGKPYAGCYVFMSVEFWAQDNSYGKRINASLRAVMFDRDGDAFTGGGAGSADDFDDIAVDTADSLA